MRLTLATVQVARALLSASESPQWGRDIGRRAAVKSGVVHPILERMITAGWLTAQRVESKEGSRRYYQITEAGRHELEGLLARAKDDPRFTHLFPAGR